MVGRPRSSKPRDRTFLIRLTREQGDLLDALGAVRRLTATTVATEAVADLVERAGRDPLVREQLTLFEKYDRRQSGEVVQLDAGKRRESPRPTKS